MERYTYRGKEFALKSNKNKTSIYVSTEGFQATLGELKALNIFISGQKDNPKEANISFHGVNKHLRELITRNSTENKRADLTNLAAKADTSGLLHPLTLVGLQREVDQRNNSKK